MASAPSQQLPPGNGELEGFWDSLGGQPAACLPQLPCPYPALPCYSWLPPAPLSLFTQPVTAPYELLPAAPRLWWPGGPVLHSPLARPGATASSEGPWSRAKAASASSSSSSRESTAALKAWLAGHAKSPYPSKGEKVLLALVSGMSLAQVSTWFANARRRLKKENRAGWRGRPPNAAAGEEDGGEEEEEGGGGGEGGAAAAPGAPQPSPELPPGPRAAGGAAAPRLEAAAAAGRGRPFSPGPDAAAGAGQARAPGPRIWRVAELATSPRRGRAAF